MQLSPRLQAIYDRISCHTLADIGTDHAYLPIALLQAEKIQYAIAADLNPGPLQIAKEHIEQYKFADKITLRLGNGLAVLSENEADTILIAGMGGELMIQILNAHLEIARSAQQLILQPMNAQAELRKWLVQNEFTIENEELSQEGYKIYNILLIKTGRMTPPENEIFYHLPKQLQSHPNYQALWEKKYREFTKMKQGQQKAANPDPALLAKYTALLKDAERMKPCF